MGLVIFAPTPSFACEKMRLLPTHTPCMHTFGPTRATVRALFLDMLLFYSLLRTFLLVIFLRFPSSLFKVIIAAGFYGYAASQLRLPFCSIQKAKQTIKQKKWQIIFWPKMFASVGVMQVYTAGLW